MCVVWCVVCGMCVVCVWRVVCVMCVVYVGYVRESMLQLHMSVQM